MNEPVITNASYGYKGIAKIVSGSKTYEYYIEYNAFDKLYQKYLKELKKSYKPKTLKFDTWNAIKKMATKVSVNGGEFSDIKKESKMNNLKEALTRVTIQEKVSNEKFTRTKLPSELKAILPGAVKSTSLYTGTSDLTGKDFTRLVVTLKDISFYGVSAVNAMQKLVTAGMRMLSIDDGSFKSKGLPIMIFDYNNVSS